MDKIYYENKFYLVYLNRVNTIKIKCKETGKVWDYFKQVYAKENHGLPQYILNNCNMLHEDIQRHGKAYMVFMLKNQ